jgi:lipopolysaccharide transport system permease protein
MALLTETREALQDIQLGWQRREGWWALSRQSIKISYRRTTLGPIWITLQQLAFIIGIGLLYSHLFKVKFGAVSGIRHQFLGLAHQLHYWSFFQFHSAVSSNYIVNVAN